MDMQKDVLRCVTHLWAQGNCLHELQCTFSSIFRKPDLEPRLWMCELTFNVHMSWKRLKISYSFGTVCPPFAAQPRCTTGTCGSSFWADPWQPVAGLHAAAAVVVKIVDSRSSLDGLHGKICADICRVEVSQGSRR
eukprot:1147992-Pelagomonas_calceolata.AAC.12